MNNWSSSCDISGIRRYTQLGSATPGCIVLTLGEPEVTTPLPIRQTVCQALLSGKTHYSPHRGEPALLQTLAEQEHCTPENLLITAGGTGALYTAFMGLVQPGDEVILLAPAFPLYETLTRMAGATPVWVTMKNNQVQDLTPYITQKTRLIVANSPNNPTGAVLNTQSIAALEQAVKNMDGYLVFDGVYAGLFPNPTPVPVTEKLLLCQSFSKTYAMTGFRCGYLKGPAEVVERLIPIQAAQFTSIPPFVQEGCIRALQTDCTTIRQLYQHRVERCSNRLRQMGLSHFVPEGGFYLFPEVPGASDRLFCDRLIAEGGVATVPGSVFHAPGHFRMSCTCSQERLDEAMNRLEQFVGQY